VSAAGKAPRKGGNRSGRRLNPVVKITMPREAIDYLRVASEHALVGDSLADWARGVLLIAAADELGDDPSEALELL
jgi:hypothetical protein